MKQATIQYLCSECNQTTTFQQEIDLGHTGVDVTCSHCGERWHVTFIVLLLEPFAIGNWRISRSLGVMRNGTFFPKEQMQ